MSQDEISVMDGGKCILRPNDEMPYWRTLKANGELNGKNPGGMKAQKEKLEAEGHTIIQKGRKNIRYYVKDYEYALFDLDETNPSRNGQELYSTSQKFAAKTMAAWSIYGTAYCK